MLCLDTNVVIAILNRRPAEIAERFRRELTEGASIALPAVALFELWFGVAKSFRRVENQERLILFLQAPIEILTFDAEDAREAGEIRAFLESGGSPIGPYDLLIAAQARRRGAALVTANEREFSRVPGLNVEDWTAKA
jgi:tRNA(fMet)-specific endonuclease VapC